MNKTIAKAKVLKAIDSIGVAMGEIADLRGDPIAQANFSDDAQQHLADAWENLDTQLIRLIEKFDISPEELPEIRR